MNADDYPPLDPVKTGLKCRCPRCGTGQVFAGYLTLKPKCSACGLDYSFIDTGEGPAVLVMMLVGFLVIGSALWLDARINLPIIVQLFIWLPISIILSLVLLRRMKAIMIAIQYKHSAAEGKIDRE